MPFIQEETSYRPSENGLEKQPEKHNVGKLSISPIWVESVCLRVAGGMASLRLAAGRDRAGDRYSWLVIICHSFGASFRY